MEVEGPLAMWARPDTGSSPTSYPIPTWSAAKGLFESVVFFADGRAWINPIRVEICKPEGKSSTGEVNYQKYMTNYGGPLRESSIINKKANYQFSALVVSNACYRLYAQIENGSEVTLGHGDNPGHALQAMFERRLKNGQCYHTPCLGWSEFVPSYWGALRNHESTITTKTEVDKNINLNLVSVLKGMFSDPVNGKYAPCFQQGDNAWIREGEFRYVE